MTGLEIVGAAALWLLAAWFVSAVTLGIVTIRWPGLDNIIAATFGLMLFGGLWLFLGIALLATKLVGWF